jgi:hypothetical protein
MSICERYVAIDNVCAWPQLTRLRDGRVAALLFNQPTHGGWEGEVECWHSGDDGRSWTRAGVPVPHEPNQARMNHASGLAGNGDLLCIVAGQSNRPRQGEPASSDFSKADPPHPVAARSSDGGVTWRPCAPIPPHHRGWVLTPFGPITRRPDGTLLASFYDWPPVAANLPPQGSALLYGSDDDGESWRFLSVIAADDYNETSILAVNETRVIAAARTFNNQTLHLFISDDGGATWRQGAPLAGAYEHNGHLMALPDGRILLTHGIRHPHDLALACRVSPDGGVTWRRPHRLLQISDSERYDGGYPSCITVGDDLILTAYYTRRSDAHHRYHMATVLWNWREEFAHKFDQ